MNYFCLSGINNSMKYTFFFLFLLIPSILFAQPSIKWQKCLGGTGNDEPGGLLQTRDGGYIMAGETHSSDGDVTSRKGNYDLWVVKINSLGVIQWQRTYGGSRDDYGGAIIESVDGGYIIAASTNSSDGDLSGIFHGDSTQSDIWVLKIDSLGNIKWQKTFGGSKDDFPTSIVRAGEGQYIISAETLSKDGDVKGFHGGSGADVWVFSMSETGVLGWQKTFGGSNHDYGAIFEIQNGYALVGTTYSHDGDVTGRRRDTTAEVWLVKLNTAGDIIWQKTYGGSDYDAGNSGVQTLDHGYIITGETVSKDGDVSGIHPSPFNFSDCWVLKLDSVGKVEWQKCLGGSNGDAGYSIFQTSDSGYIVSASTASGDGDVKGFHGNSDCWIFKLSKKGDLIWQKTLGGSASNGASGSGIMPTADSGFLVETMTWSNDGDVHGLHGDSNNADIWLVKLSQDLSEVKNVREVKTGSIYTYPNPSTGKTTVYYDLDKPSEVKIEIFNLLGVQLRPVLFNKEEAGIHEHEIDISSLPSGSYFFRIERDGVSVLKAVELIK
jgi:hypothetical protein